MRNEQAQIAILTTPARYEKLFRKVATAIGPNDNRKLRILSFGCSVGDEIATLYSAFPNAEIFGCDIDEIALEDAKRSVGHLATVFNATYEEMAAHGPYDIIFALSVLCISPAPKDFAEKFPFSKFDYLVSMLDSLLKDGGLLGITNASYLFTSTETFKRYSIIRDGTSVIWGGGELFCKNGESIFRRKGTRSRMMMVPSNLSELHDELAVSDDLFRKENDKASAELNIVEVVSPVANPANFRLVCEWLRSNFDGLPKELAKGFMEIRWHYKLMMDPQTGSRYFLGKTSRSCFFSEGYVETREELYPLASRGLDSPLF